MSYHTLATLAAAWSDDRNGCFGLDYDNAPAVDPAINPVWQHFVPAMQVVADCGEDNEYNGFFVWSTQAQHPTLGLYTVAWCSHSEGRGPCQVTVTPVMPAPGQLPEISGGPLQTQDQPGPVLTALLQQGTWQYPGDLPGAAAQ